MLDSLFTDSSGIAVLSALREQTESNLLSRIE
jgi:hypothetical protein